MQIQFFKFRELVNFFGPIERSLKNNGVHMTGYAPITTTPTSPPQHPLVGTVFPDETNLVWFDPKTKNNISFTMHGLMKGRTTVFYLFTSTFMDKEYLQALVKAEDSFKKNIFYLF